MKRLEILVALLAGVIAADAAVQYPAVVSPVLVGTAVIGTVTLFLKRPEK